MLRASVDAVGRALMSLARHLAIGTGDEVQRLAQPLVDALAARQQAMDPVAFRQLFT